MAGPRKEPIWLGSTRKDLSEASERIRKAMGGAIRVSQRGGKSDLASPMSGDLSDVMEVRENDDAGTYRLMYTTRIGAYLFILDFFQKKSKTGSTTPKVDLDRVRFRLKKAREYAAKANSSTEKRR